MRSWPPFRQFWATSSFKAPYAACAVFFAFLTLAYSCGPTTPPPQEGRGKSSSSAETDQAKGESEDLKPGQNDKKGEKPPATRRMALVENLHGVQVADPYRWLEDEKSSEVQKWLKAMDGYTRKHLNSLTGRDELAKRLEELSYFDYISAPKRRGERYFFVQRHKNKEKKVHYWRQGDKGPAKILLDPNKMSKDGSTSVLDVFPDHQGKNVAYKVSKNNADEATLHVMNVATGDVSKKDTIPGAKYAKPAWTPDGKGFYYTRLPMDPDIPVAERPGYAEVYFHRLGTDPSEDILVHPKTGDPCTFLITQLSRDGRYLFVTKARGWSQFEVFWKDLRKGKRAKFKTFAKAPEGEKALYRVFAWKRWIYVLTNEGAPRYRVFRVNPRRPSRKNWQEIIPEQDDAVLDEFKIMGGHMMLKYMKNASTELRVANLKGKITRKIELPSIGSVSDITGTPEDDTAYYDFCSYIYPRTVYKTSISKGTSSVHFQLNLPVNGDPYTINQVWYPSKDGTKVSMFLIHRKNIKRDGSNPCLLYGYGGFNVSITPKFIPTYLVWIEQGGVVAIPNLRGGGEYGESWHRAGMLKNKQNTFDDFTAAAKYLINEKYTSPARLAIRGGSNGGLLVGAAMVQAPKLFRAVTCHVPLLDMVRYHKFGSGQTWIPEYGSADDPEQFKFIYAYSPYHHVRKGEAYPAMLMFSADSDDRVDPMHARKFTAAVLNASSSPHPVLMRLEEKAGHGGGDMVKKTVARTADELVFLFKELGVKTKPTATTGTEEPK